MKSTQNVADRCMGGAGAWGPGLPLTVTPYPLRRLMRCGLSACLLMMLAACRIEIEVPEGGRVIGAVGDSICRAGETCSISVTDTSFSEQFVAIADDGYEFTHWQRKHRGLCGGNSTDCVLSTAQFGGNSALMSLLASDEVFYLTPVFTRVSSQALVYIGRDEDPDNGETELYAVEDDGRLPRRLSPDFVGNSGKIVAFDLSPDKQWVAYTANYSAQEVRLYVAPVSGEFPAQQLSPSVTGAEVREFHWSPDSYRLVFSANVEGLTVAGLARRPYQVYLVDRDGANLRRINGHIGAPARVEVRNPQWSPDGRYIVQEVYELESAGTSGARPVALNIYDSAISSDNSRRLVDGTRIDEVSWSPDAARLAYLAIAPGGSELHLFSIGVVDSRAARVSDVGDANGDASWSPGGNLLAYLQADAGVSRDSADLVISRATPGAVGTVLATSIGSNPGLIDYAWSPDGRSIGYTADTHQPGLRELYVVRTDRPGSPTRVSKPLVSGNEVINFSWSPDGRRLAYIVSGRDRIDLYLTDPGGLAQGSLTTGLSGEAVRRYRWSADGLKLAFTTSDYGNPLARFPARRLYVSDLPGLQRRVVNDPRLLNLETFEY